MDTSAATLIGLGIVALLLIFFFKVFRHRGKFTIKTKLGEVTAEGENSPPVSPPVVKTSDTHETLLSKPSAASTEIRQISTGANVIVAQTGANVIVQTGDRPAPIKKDESKNVSETSSVAVPTPLSDAKSEPVPVRAPIENSFDNECDTPPPTTTWVGRTEELSLMDGSPTKVIAITGIGGQGKSTLAAKYLSNIQKDTVFWDWRDCKEESNTLHTHVVRIIERLSRGKRRAKDLSNESTESVIKLLFQYCTGGGGVFVFDNIDHYIDIERSQAVDGMQMLIAGAIKTPPGFKWIFTCRPKLEYGDPCYLQIELHGLSIEETRQLFISRKLSFEDAVIDKVHELTQGHPLWLNLIATQVLAKRANISDLINRIKSGKEEKLPYPMLQEIWKGLTTKQQKLLRYLAEIVRPETEKRLAEYVSGDLNFHKFSKALQQLKVLDMVVVKSRNNAPDTIELHPLVREFVRRQFSHSERTHYIFAIMVSLDKVIIALRPSLKDDVPYSTLDTWIAKLELLINNEDFEKALAGLDEIRIPLLRQGYVEDFVKLVVVIFAGLNWTVTGNVEALKYDKMFQELIETLSHLGRHAEADEHMQRFESAVSGRTARYIALCDMKCHSYWVRNELELAKEWGRRGVEIKSTSHIDTQHDCGHNLALAQRDSGELEPALEFFLHETPLDSVTDPTQIDYSRGGSFYGNVGRCLYFKKLYEPALSCLVKSAWLHESTSDSTALINQGWAAQWLGQVLEQQKLFEKAYICFRRAEIKWKSISPPRAELTKADAVRLLKANNLSSVGALEDWQIDRQFLTWLEKTKRFPAKGS